MQRDAAIHVKYIRRAMLKTRQFPETPQRVGMSKPAGLPGMQLPDGGRTVLSR